jgi:uncharacterized protein with PIN domain
MSRLTASIHIDPDLRFLLPVRHRGGVVAVVPDATSSIAHVVESLGVPLTEVGELRVAGVRIAPQRTLGTGDAVDVRPVRRPQRLDEERFLLDIHLGALARRMRLVGLDTAYPADADDAELVAQASAEHRVLLTRDRGLLRRRALPAGAYVRGDRADEQLADVVDRFAPALRPWTRCPACNGMLIPATMDEVEDRLEPGTRRTYTQFSRCPDCGRTYWRGAHAARLTAVIEGALRSAGSREERHGTGEHDG